MNVDATYLANCDQLRFVRELVRYAPMTLLQFIDAHMVSAWIAFWLVLGSIYELTTLWIQRRR